LRRSCEANFLLWEQRDYDPHHWRSQLPAGFITISAFRAHRFWLFTASTRHREVEAAQENVKGRVEEIDRLFWEGKKWLLLIGEFGTTAAGM